MYWAFLIAGGIFALWLIAKMFQLKQAVVGAAIRLEMDSVAIHALAEQFGELQKAIDALRRDQDELREGCRLLGQTIGGLSEDHDRLFGIVESMAEAVDQHEELLRKKGPA